MSECKVVENAARVLERRRKQFLIRKDGRFVATKEEALAKEFGVSVDCLHIDWTRRGGWLPDLLGLEDVNLLREVVTGQFQAYIEECWAAIQQLKEKGFWHQYNGAMKNLREILVDQSELLQSLGDLPKMAQELKVERVEVNASVADIDVLNKAAGILNQKDGSQKRPESLH
jgi:hypothetical protein